MKIAILFYQLPKFPDAQRDEVFAVMFEGKVLAPEKYDLMLLKDMPYGAHATPEILNDLWRMTQNDFYEQGWRPMQAALPPCRSSMVGDIFMVGDEFYVVTSLGFEKINEASGFTRLLEARV